ncbi:MAG: RraA family protein, partial [Pricia sp.]|nr:RraA family protein [Pricia sp.]
MKRNIFLVTTLLLGFLHMKSQDLGASSDYVKTLTSQWKGERFDDGRPKVPDLV